MSKSRKNNKKSNNRIKRKTVGRRDTTKKCIYTDEAKRLMKIIKELRKKNKTRKNKNT
jgi:hypothetical protein